MHLNGQHAGTIVRDFVDVPAGLAEAANAKTASGRLLSLWFPGAILDARYALSGYTPLNGLWHGMAINVHTHPGGVVVVEDLQSVAAAVSFLRTAMSKPQPLQVVFGSENVQRSCESAPGWGLVGARAIWADPAVLATVGPVARLCAVTFAHGHLQPVVVNDPDELEIAMELCAGGSILHYTLPTTGLLLSHFEDLRAKAVQRGDLELINAKAKITIKEPGNQSGQFVEWGIVG